MIAETAIVRTLFDNASRAVFYLISQPEATRIPQQRELSLILQK